MEFLCTEFFTVQNTYIFVNEFLILVDACPSQYFFNDLPMSINMFLACNYSINTINKQCGVRVYALYSYAANYKLLLRQT